ncbi:hypothetical protein [Aquirufa antheringensis]|uniref:hypothetical protein n=1 Tax=Aquirufa antheringensis TaxID=2516559 RepID=UPI0010329331|nr:hypothetical protein [Aquirufa antheringensis]MCE4217939.1 hypothetical protein [Pseudarcicella sp. GAP-15]TBH71538.1 hypothetical protein EWU21_04375 [Aquirufa antheringensis]
MGFRIYARLIFVFLSFSIKAQTGIGTTTPNAAAKLEIAATDKGLLIPRMTKAQREAITLSSAANGLMVYQTDDLAGFYVNTSTTTTVSWTRVNSNWTRSGNDIAFTTGNVSTTGTLTGGNTSSSTISGFAANVGTISSAYNISAADNGKILQSTSATAITITIPTGLPTGFNCTVVQMGAGQLTFSGTYFNRGSFTKSASQYSVISIIHLGSNNIIVSGEMSN